MPDFRFEDAVGGLVAGIDEVGRGPLAGPVVAAAVILRRDAVPEGLDDSKKLNRATRERLFSDLRRSAVIGVAAASSGEIDRVNILQATFLAMARALHRLPQVPDHVLVDGNRAPPLPIGSTCVVAGDSLSLSIAAASVVAKVVRDRLMERLALRHPAYGFDRNAGYPTAEHRAALLSLGPCVHHRRSFGTARLALAQVMLPGLTTDGSG
ncbi:ribonuclease HII [Zavarzinia sp. CC-PAN008]|uniref:ribonuclease HII n=1 Tax=Zavarzinia sp. CC-PAN008 TaxID=3243332 RepID=UPI003F743518